MSTKHSGSTCPKCNGARRIERYSGIAEGVCFECKGTGRVHGTAARAQLADAPEYTLTAERALAQLRVWYVCAQRCGAEWFSAEAYETSGVGMRGVHFYAAALDATERAKVIAAFEALAA